MPCISGLIHQYCKNTDTEFDCLKRGTSYVYVTLTRNVDDRLRTIQFADVLSYSSPCSLDQYLKQWGASAQKSIFPYEKYSSIEQLRADTEFPPYDDFYSSIKKV